MQAIILGLVQGLTEFLPVSSSGHLILMPYLFNWTSQEISFDVALHFGTALAVLIFFYKDWINMLLSFKEDIISKNLSNLHLLRHDTKQLITIFIVSIPVGIIGVLFESDIEYLFRNPSVVAIMLILVSIVMWLAEYTYKKISHKREISFTNALIISLSQILALIPGTSRSGISLSAGLFRGIERESVAKFSFLLATPIILGATLVNLPDLLDANGNLFYVLVGVITSFLSGFIAIRFLLKYLRNNSLNLFIIYRLILGVIILILVL